MNYRFPKLASIIFALSLLAGCATLGPQYQRPDTEDLLSKGMLINSGYKSDPVLEKWWLGFDDTQLNQLIDLALQHNRSILALASNLRAARSNLTLATLDYLPTDQSSASSGRSRQSAASLGVLAPSDGGGQVQALPDTDFYNVSVAPRWELDLFGKITRQKQIAKAQYDLQLAELQGLQLMVIADVASQYFRLQSLYVEQAVVKKNIQLQEQSEGIVAKQFEVGRVTEKELLSARVQRQVTQSALPTLQANIKAAQYRLAVLTGRSPGALESAQLGVSDSAFLKTPLPVGTIGSLIDRQPDIRQAEQRLISANAEVGLAISQQFPTLSLTGSAGYSAENRQDLFEDNAYQFSYGPALNWSLSNLLRGPQRINAAKARKQAATFNYEQAILQTLSELNMALDRHQANQTRQALLNFAADNARESARISKIQYQAGASSLLELLTAQASLLQRELEAQRGIYDIVDDQITVFRVLGAG